MALDLEPVPDGDGHAEEPGGPAGQPQNLQDWLRQRRERLAAHTTEDFDIPGYSGRLVGRYRRLSMDELNDAVYSEGSIVERNAQTLIAACVGFYGRHEDGRLERLDNDGLPGYAGVLPVLGFDDIESVRHGVVELFGGNEHAVIDHADDVVKWIRSLNDADDDALVGGP